MPVKDHAPSPRGSRGEEASSNNEEIGPDRRRTLPAWLDHFNSHDLKTFSRCWAATFAASILVFVGPALRSIGVATFFAAIILYIVPPTSILFLYLLAALSGLFGMCLAWAWGLLAMKASLAARSDSETQTAVLALQRQAAMNARQSGQSLAWEAQKLVHDGAMLDARVTIVFYVLCCLFIYALTRLRYNNPKLILLHVLAVIVIDIFLVIGPSLTTFNASLASLLSTSYVALQQMEKLVLMTESCLDVTRKHLASHAMQVSELMGARSNLIAAYKSLEPSIIFLPLDISRGRWNADDVESVQGRVRELLLCCLSLLDFHTAKVEATQKKERLLEQAQGEKGSTVEKNSHQVGSLLEAIACPDHGSTQESTMAALQATTADVLRVCSRSIKLAAECIHTVNACRWIGKPSQQRFDELDRELQNALTTLRSARKTCVDDFTEEVLESQAHLFDKEGQLKGDDGVRPCSLQGIIVSMVMEDRILDTAVAVEKLLEHISHLNKTRTSHRIWLPSRLRYAIAWLSSPSSYVPASGAPANVDADSDSLDSQVKEAYRQLRIGRRSNGTRARRGRLVRAIVKAYMWLTNPAGIFASRMVIVSIATAIPASIPSSAGFYYRNKGLWVLITGQTCLLEYSADFTFSLVSRSIGTLLGALFGLCAWYIGSGNGPGNPYGLSAITAVFTAIIVWWRLFLPPAFVQAVIMVGSTFALIVGFSYDNDHVEQYGLPGKGYEAFWKRLVTVLLGFVACTLVQLAPRPPSASSHVRKTLANSARTLADHYALLLSRWARSEQNSSLGTVAEQVSLQVADTLISLDEPIKMLKFELSLSAFDQRVLKRAREQCQYMNLSLGRLLILSASLPQKLQDRLLQTVGLLDERVIGEVMGVLGIIEQSLRTGCPLPERLPTPLISRSWPAQSHELMLSTTLVRDEDYRRYCVAIASYVRLLSTVDDLVLLLKGALGECHIVRRSEGA